LPIFPCGATRKADFSENSKFRFLAVRDQHGTGQKWKETWSRGEAGGLLRHITPGTGRKSILRHSERPKYFDGPEIREKTVGGSGPGSPSASQTPFPPERPPVGAKRQPSFPGSLSGVTLAGSLNRGTARRHRPSASVRKAGPPLPPGGEMVRAGRLRPGEKTPKVRYSLQRPDAAAPLQSGRRLKSRTYPRGKTLWRSGRPSTHQARE